MMTNVTKSAFYAIALTSGFLFSCNNDPENPAEAFGRFGEGVYITNEGNTQTNTGTISYFNPSTSQVENNIFSTENDMDLGIYVQSIADHNDKGYIAVDNMNRVYVVDINSFELEAIIEDLAKPQHFIGLNDTKGYIAQWGADGFGGDIAVVNLATNTVSGNIAVGLGPKQMLLHGNNLIVLNTGGFGLGNSFSVINTQNDQVTHTVEIGDNPNSAVIDRNGALWILCGGRYKSDWSGLETKGKIYKINTSSYSIEAQYEFESDSSQPGNLAIDNTGDNLFYTYNRGVHTSSITDFAVTNPIINRSFYGFGVSKSDNMIYGANAVDFASAGWLIRFTSAGVPQDSVRVGIAPSGFLFR
ncbi:YncE family protein [Anditalea andensis]|uniref:Cell surface protein n=1 Tax=Anditalea andensis TaxID=1048983 RepID=A0A074KWT3_9BACT|nr:DUF5074 domain-containing protein [Anditalea andensis]KEO74446.1 hypothetical protein EL17_06830 [Anditalea andensis]